MEQSRALWAGKRDVDGYLVDSEHSPSYIVYHVFGNSTLIFLWEIPNLLYSVHEIKEMLTPSLTPDVSVSLKFCSWSNPFLSSVIGPGVGIWPSALVVTMEGKFPLSLRSQGQAGVSWCLTIQGECLPENWSHMEDRWARRLRGLWPNDIFNFRASCTWSSFCAWTSHKHDSIYSFFA